MAASNCPACNAVVDSSDRWCRHCGMQFIASENLIIPRQPSSLHRVPPDKSSLAAGCLGFFLGPVGLWYKGHWAAGFAWLVMTILLSIGTGGLAAPVCWLGMAIHAAVADTK